MIVVDSVTKVYENRGMTVTAVDDVSLTVGSGEIHGILGRSGAGKTTLLRCLNLLERPTSGTITVDGLELVGLSDADLRSARQRIGTVFQHFNLFHARTVSDNIAFPLEITGVGRSERRARVAELLDLVGLTDRANAFPSQLSGGQKQRVGIARALAAHPSVLLCDEATSALDPATTEQILDLIKVVNETTGVTVVLITHESGVVRRICDSAGLMEDGRLVESGRLADLLADPGSRLAEQLIPVGRPTDSEPSVEYILSFRSESATEPVLSHASRELGLDVSILSGSVEQVGGRTAGRLRVALSRPLDGPDHDRFVGFLAAQGVMVSRP
ncbi:methionine ABC transporter ATP-binding protein [Propionicicella superfundia]|uniref:methionine ABC transporter ATP-binding protein n=1 Tax=Propionicicella superfundia TaxID=348582 RepID=UPI0003F8C91A|nr:ATP-binding cassette domain-containing protein [Propionicicella superfundia]